MWPLQASGSHRLDIRNQSLPPLFVLLHHDVMATRQQGDELRVMDICIGTFPFPPPASVHIKSLAHHTSVLPPQYSSASSHTENPRVETFLLCVRSIVQCLTASQLLGHKIVNYLSRFRHRKAQDQKAGGILLKGSRSEKKRQFSAVFNLFHQLQQRGLKGRL